VSRASVALNEEAREQARRIQQQVPTFAETLLSVQWRLADNPTAGRAGSRADSYIYRQDPAPGSPGVRVTYTYHPGEVVIVAVELVT